MGVKVGTFDQKTSTGTQAISGLGFQPEIVIFFSSGATADDTYQASYNGMFGITTGTAAADNGSVAAATQDAQTTGAHQSSGRAAQKAITFCEWGEVVLSEADLDSFDADGFTLDWTTADAVARKINYIAVSGFTSVKLVEWQMNASLGNQSVTGVGFIPDTVINIYEMNTTLTGTTPYVTASGGLGLGAFNATDEWGFGSWDEETNNTTTNGVQSNVDFLASLTNAGTARYSSFVSMDSDGFTLNVAANFSPRPICYALCLKGGPQIKIGVATKAVNAVGSTAESIGFRPGGIIFGTANPSLDKTVITDIMISVGVADRASQESMEFHVDELATSDANKINIPNRAVLVNLNHDSTIESQAHADHFNSDGFQLNWGATPGSPVAHVGYIAFEEEDLSGVTGEALKVFTGVFDKKTSTGSQAITGIGFTPKIVLCWYSGAIADDTWADFLRAGFGAATSSTNRYAAGTAAEEDLTTSNTAATKSNAHIISIVDPDAVLEGEADLTSFDSDGFTLDWTTANGVAYKIHYLALGGSDEIEDAKILSFVTDLTTGQQSVTGAGFRPDSIICFGNNGFNSGEDAQYAQGGLLLAISDGANNRGVGGVLDDAQSNEGHRTTVDIDGFIEGTTRTGIEDLHSVFVSFDDDGFTFDQLNAAPSPGYRVFALCIKGLITTTKNFNSEISTTGDKAYTGVGFEPVGLLSFGGVSDTDDSIPTHYRLAIGCSDGTNHNAQFSSAQWLTGNLGCISKVGSVGIHDSGTLVTLDTDEEGVLSSFDSDGFTINWTTSDALAIRNMYMAFRRNFIQSEAPAAGKRSGIIFITGDIINIKLLQPKVNEILWSK